MRSAKNIETLITNSKIDTSGKMDQAVLADLLKTLDESQKTPSAPPGPSAWRIIIKHRVARLFAAVAAVIIIVALLATLDPTASSVYARAIESLENADTFHVTVTMHQNEQWYVGSEMWYKRGVGLALLERDKEKDSMRIYDGTHLWEYIHGDDFAVRTSGIAPEYFIKEISSIGLAEDSVEDPSGERIIDGSRCQLYVSLNSHNSRQTHMWVDSTDRVREIKVMSSREDEGQHIEYIAEFQYDIPIDPARFSTDFGTNVEIVDVAEMFEREFSTEDSIIAKETLGMLYSIHHAEQCNDGSVYLVASFRPTEDSRQLIGRQRSPSGYSFGTSPLSSAEYVDKTEASLGVLQLAIAHHNGMEVKWYLLVNRGPQTANTSACRLSIILHNVYKLRAYRDEQGLPVSRLLSPIISPSISDIPRPLDEIMEEVYLEAEFFEPVLATVRVSSEYYTNTHGGYGVRSATPSEISLEQYIREILKAVNQLKHR